MYVVRPQFFIPTITVLRNAALNALTYKSELALARAQTIDITNFEQQVEEFKNTFGRNWRLASDSFDAAPDSQPNPHPTPHPWAPRTPCATL
jgi:hypothetical protein